MWFWEMFDDWNDVVYFLDKHNLSPGKVVITKNQSGGAVVVYHAECELLK